LAQLFHGANPLQIPAAKIEQIFEAASSNLYNLVKKNIISKSDALTGQQAFLQAGINYYQQESGVLGIAGFKGLRNMQDVINNKIIGPTSQLPDDSVINLPSYNFSNLHQYYQGGSGWYPTSIQAATTLTDQYINTLNPITSKAKDVLTSITNSFGISQSKFTTYAIITIIGFIILKKVL